MEDVFAVAHEQTGLADAAIANDEVLEGHCSLHDGNYNACTCAVQIPFRVQYGPSRYYKMIRHDTPSSEPFRLLRLRLDVTDCPERPTEQQLLAPEPPMLQQSDDAQLTFQNHRHASSPHSRDPSHHQALTQQNQFLKQQLQRIKERIIDYQEMLRNFKQLQEEAASRQAQLYEKEAAIGALTSNVRSLEKRKAVLEFELQKTTKMLEQHCQETERCEREVAEAMGRVAERERENVDLMARHEKEVRVMREENAALNQQFQAVKEETKKLVAKLNNISLQKEGKLIQDLDNFKLKYQQCQQKLNIATNQNQQLQAQVRRLKEVITNNRSEQQRSLMNLKLQSQKHLSQLKLSKQSQLNRSANQLRSQIDRLDKDLTKLQSTLTLKDSQLHQHQQSLQRLRSRQQSRLQKTSEDYQRRLEKKDTQIDILKRQLQLKQQDLTSAEAEADNEESCGKVQALERSVKEMYEQSAQLEGKLMEAVKERAMAVSQAQQAKSELKSFREIVAHYQGKNRMFSQEETQYLTEIRDLKAKVEQLEDTNLKLEKKVKDLAVALTKSREAEDKLLNENQQNKQKIAQKQILTEKLTHQNEKHKSFIQTYKNQSQKMKQNTERRWKELKKLYQQQLQTLENRLKASQAREKALIIQLENSERLCKQYEYELTMSTQIKQIEHSYRG